MLPPVTDSIQESIGLTPMVKLTPQNKGKNSEHLTCRLT